MVRAVLKAQHAVPPADRFAMRACAECQFLMDDDAVECKFCHASVARAERADSTVPSGATVPADPTPSADPTVLAGSPPASSSAVSPSAQHQSALPYSDAPSPRGAVEGTSRKVVVGVVAGVALLLVGVGVTTLSGDDEPVSTGPRVTAVAAPTTAPVATTTTGLTALTTTSIPPKSGLRGKPVPIGMDGLFTATMPPGTTKLSGDARSTTWGATLPGGSTVTFKAQTAASIADRYKTSVGRIDVSKYGKRVNTDLGVTGTPPRFGAFPTGTGAEWDTSSTGSAGRVTLIDGGSMAYLLVLQHSGGLPVADVADYLAVSASLRPA